MHTSSWPRLLLPGTLQEEIAELKAYNSVLQESIEGEFKQHINELLDKDLEIQDLKNLMLESYEEVI